MSVVLPFHFNVSSSHSNERAHKASLLTLASYTSSLESQEEALECRLDQEDLMRSLTKREEAAINVLREAAKELIPWRTAEQCGLNIRGMDILVKLRLVDSRTDLREGKLYMLRVERRMTG